MTEPDTLIRKTAAHLLANGWVYDPKRSMAGYAYGWTHPVHAMHPQGVALITAFTRQVQAENDWPKP